MDIRHESEHATARRGIRLAHLKLVDFVCTDDALEFPYKDRVFAATLTREGYIACARHSAHALAEHTDASRSYYRLPSKYTNDCVAVYWKDKGAPAGECRTNPSGYERVRHVRTGKTLNQLRDAYMERYRKAPLPPADGEPEWPDEYAGSAGPKRARPAPPAATDFRALAPDALGRQVARVLGDGAVTITTIQASVAVSGYKDIAGILQTKLAEQRNVLLALLARVEYLVWPTRPTEPTAIVEAALASAGAPPVSAPPPPAPPPARSELTVVDLDALMSAAF